MSAFISIHYFSQNKDLRFIYIAWSKTSLPSLNNVSSKHKYVKSTHLHASMYILEMLQF